MDKLDSLPRPGGVAATELRTAIGHFATGVAVVTARSDNGTAFGSTANALTSVSLEPPLLLVCLRRESETLAALLVARRFAVNVLRHGQRELAERFARPAARGTWAGVEHGPAPQTGAPLIAGALATLECTVHDLADGGDHTIVIGRVVAVEHPSDHVAPLIFYRGSFTPPPPAPPEPELSTVRLPSAFGDLRLVPVSATRERVISVIALVGRPEDSDGSLVYLHEGCVLGDALGHTGCAGRVALHSALERMRNAGHGVLVYERDDSEPFGGCCVDGGGTRPRAAGSPAGLRQALRDLRLRRVHLLAGGAQAPQAHAPQAHALGLDVAQVSVV
jgi:flavin reductase (DIM6/NTAB) family NADH-FMN oxidoreductase RutF